MTEYGEIFSNQPPIPASKIRKSPLPQCNETKPKKRKYTRKMKPEQTTNEAAGAKPTGATDGRQTFKDVPPVNKARPRNEALRPMAAMVDDVDADGQAAPLQGEATRIEVFTHSFGLEYISALKGLLALIGEPQRIRLLDFIIDNRII